METTQEKIMSHKSSIIKEITAFVKDVITWSLSGGLGYQIYLCVLAALMVLGVYAYFVQINQGLAATNMSDIVSWGFYIANFTFLVGVAAAAVMIILPSYFYKDKSDAFDIDFVSKIAFYF